MNADRTEIVVAKELDLPETLTEEILNVSEDSLPDVLQNRMQLLQETNNAYSLASKSAEKAKKKVDAALKNADKLIEEARTAGTHADHESGVWIFRGKHTGDRIADLEDNLQELITHNVKTAEAHKELLEINEAVMDAQTALLCVQKTQMKYQECIADVTKFLFGLCALNQSGLGSILINLNAIVDGASKEQLGEMALEQLKSTIAQIKSQEDIIYQLRENRADIEYLETDLDNYNSVMEKNFQEQYEAIQQQAKDLAEQAKQQAEVDEAQNREIEESELKNKEQDEALRQQIEKDKEHDIALEQQMKKDVEHEEALKQHAEKNKEQDEALQQLTLLENKLDEETRRQAEVDKKHDSLIEECQQKDASQDMAIQHLSDEFARKLQDEIDKQTQKNDKLDQLISDIEQKNANQDNALQQSSDKIFAKIQDEVDKQTQKNDKLDQLISEITQKNTDQDNSMRQLSEKFYEKLDDEVKKQSQKNTEDDAQFEDILKKYEAVNEEKTNKPVTYGTMAVAIIAFVMALVQFFI